MMIISSVSSFWLTFNSIEWIQMAVEIGRACITKCLSIPLNGFTALALLKLARAKGRLSIPLNGFSFSHSSSASLAFSSTFNSIEWIPGTVLRAPATATVSLFQFH